MSQECVNRTSDSDSDDKEDVDSSQCDEINPVESSGDESEGSGSEETTTSDDELGEEEEELALIHESVCRTAEMNNLTNDMTKDLIKMLMSNDQVMAICKLRAEEIERHKEEGKENFKKQLLYDSPDGIKLTRNKARELNHSISNVLPALDLKAIEPDEEVVELVQAEFHEEDGDGSDDEYDPEEDEANLSDDYSTATCSDIESQPRTPGDALIFSEADDSPIKSEPKVQYDEEEGVFKVPVEPKSPTKPHQDDIAKRTRSQVSLATTAIETIQNKFVPPDLEPIPPEIPTEMVEDAPWTEFLQQFQNPLGDDNDDDDEEKEKEDENDPDYVTNLTGTVGDNYDVTLPKREVQALIDELLEGFEESFNPDFPNDLEIETLKASFSMPSTPVPQIPVACKAVRGSYAEQNQYIIANHASLLDLSNISYHNYCPNESQATDVPLDMELQQEPEYVEPLVVLDAASTFGDNFNMVLGNNNKLYLVERETTEGVVDGCEETVEGEIEDGDTNINGWTRSSIKILQRQLLAHIQFAGQLFTQCYSHPEAWQMARNFIEMIEELVDIVQRESAPFLSVLCWNLQDMLRICNDWKRDLDVDTEENQKYVKDLVEYENKVAQFKRFHPVRLAELWINNKAFMFHQYLPKRVVNSSQSLTKATPGELKLFVLSAIESSSKEKRAKLKFRERRSAANYYEVRYNAARDTKFLMTMAFGSKLSPKDNPIIAYFNRNELPEIVHEELKFASYEDVVLHVNKPKYTLSRPWNSYVYGAERKERMRPPSRLIPRTPKSLVKRSPKPMKPNKQPIVVSQRDIKALKKLIDKVRREETRCPKLEAIRRKKVLTKKLHNLLQFTENEYDGQMKELCGNSISSKIFFYIKEFDLFVRLVLKGLDRDTSWVEVPSNQAIESHQQDRDRTSGVVFKKGHKDEMFAWSFIAQIEEKLKKRKDSKLIDDFWSILQEFNVKNQRVEDFYLKLEQKFLNNHSDVIVSLLDHLLPHHGQQIGKFFNRIVKHDSNSFRSDLKAYEERHEEQLTSIYSVLNEFSSWEGISMSKIRQCFLGILSGNPLLETWFLKLFPRAERDNGDATNESVSGSLLVHNSILIPVHLIQYFQSVEFTQKVNVGGVSVKRNPMTTKRKITSRTVQKNRKIAKVDVVSKSPPPKTGNGEWTRAEDQVLFNTINGLNDCPQDDILKILFDTFPDKTQKQVERRFHDVVALIKSLV